MSRYLARIAAALLRRPGSLQERRTGTAVLTDASCSGSAGTERWVQSGAARKLACGVG